ncbi:uncharacterized protein LOC142162675 isoform X3 [Nicotiana tabacum]|uniref:Uncharacterized protein LOC142162675 isoform X3 n=1 Tax=Nicotiana tabacum TaxID=4097 RepID=A0AC58RRD6_TOBAC
MYRLRVRSPFICIFFIFPGHYKSEAHVCNRTIIHFQIYRIIVALKAFALSKHGNSMMAVDIEVFFWLKVVALSGCKRDWGFCSSFCVFGKILIIQSPSKICTKQLRLLSTPSSNKFVFLFNISRVNCHLIFPTLESIRYTPLPWLL